MQREAVIHSGHAASPHTPIVQVQDAQGDQDAQSFRTRLAAGVMLAVVIVAFGACGRATYYALSDSFVAPIILSPDSELVIQSKLNLNRLLAERDAAAARIEECSAAIDAAEQGIANVEAFEHALSGALTWARTMNSRQLSAGSREIQMLAEQRRALEDLQRKQADYVTQLSQQRKAGLVHAADVEREQNVLGQLRIAALQTGREQVTAETQLGTATLSKSALVGEKPSADLATPELVTRQDHIVRAQLELLKLRADRHARLAQLKADKATLAKIDELVGDMQARPIFRAIRGKQHVAFVPYTQLQQVRKGARVLECKLWGVAFCEDVGEINELLSGEVVMQDPWGSPSRGQYAVLHLSDPHAARAKSLRVRAGSKAVRHASAATHKPATVPTRTASIAAGAAQADVRRAPVASTP